MLRAGILSALTWLCCSFLNAQSWTSHFFADDGYTVQFPADPGPVTHYYAGDSSQVAVLTCEFRGFSFSAECASAKMKADRDPRVVLNSRMDKLMKYLNLEKFGEYSSVKSHACLPFYGITTLAVKRNEKYMVHLWLGTDVQVVMVIRGKDRFPDAGYIQPFVEGFSPCR